MFRFIFPCVIKVYKILQDSVLSNLNTNLMEFHTSIVCQCDHTLYLTSSQKRLASLGIIV